MLLIFNLSRLAFVFSGSIPYQYRFHVSYRFKLSTSVMEEGCFICYNIRTNFDLWYGRWNNFWACIKTSVLTSTFFFVCLLLCVSSDIFNHLFDFKFWNPVLENIGMRPRAASNKQTFRKNKNKNWLCVGRNDALMKKHSVVVCGSCVDVVLVLSLSSKWPQIWIHSNFKIIVGGLWMHQE